MAKLIVKQWGAKAVEHDLVRQRTKIGRSQVADVPLKHKSVSRKQAVIEQRSNRYVLMDAGSKNGMLVNGDPAVELILTDGDIIEVGLFEITFQETKHSSTHLEEAATVRLPKGGLQELLSEARSAAEKDGSSSDAKAGTESLEHQHDSEEWEAPKVNPRPSRVAGHIDSPPAVLTGQRNLDKILHVQKLTDLANLFIENEITDDLLQTLTDHDLKEIGVNKLGPRKRLLIAFRQYD